MAEKSPDQKEATWDTSQETAKANNRGRRNLIVGGAAGLLLVCCCLVALLAGLIFVDPFGWQLMDRLTGRYDPVASAMPEDTALYIGIDALALTPQKIDRIIGPFFDAAEEPDVASAEDALDEFDQELQAELGVTIQDDIMPWIGQYAGLGMTNVQTDIDGDLQELSLIAAIITRNHQASDSFLEKLATGVSASSGNSFNQETYEGVTIYVMNTDDPLEQLAFARHDSLVLIGTGLTEIQEAIDVQSSQSLAATDNYRSLIAELPGGRGLTIYLDGGRFEEIATALDLTAGTGINPSTLPEIDFDSAAAAISLADEGLQLDFVSKSDAGQLDKASRTVIEADPAGEPADHSFPEQTVMLISGQNLNLAWEAIRQGFVAENSQADWDEAMTLFADEFGLNPDTELMPYLDGAWGLGFLPASSGLLADELDVAIGFTWLAGTSDPAALGASLSDFSEGLASQFAVQELEHTDGITYSLGLTTGDYSYLVYGINGDQMFLASDTDSAQKVLTEEGISLADSEPYNQLWTSFPAGHTPTFFLDIQGLLNAIREGVSEFNRQDLDDAEPLLRPLTYVAATSDAKIAGDHVIRHVSTIFFVEPTE